MEFCNSHLVCEPPSRLVSDPYFLFFPVLPPLDLFENLPHTDEYDAQGEPARGTSIPLRHLRQGPRQVPRPGGQVSSQSSSNRGVLLKKTLFSLVQMGGNFGNVFF